MNEGKSVRCCGTPDERLALHTLRARALEAEVYLGYIERTATSPTIEIRLTSLRASLPCR